MKNLIKLLFCLTIIVNCLCFTINAETKKDKTDIVKITYEPESPRKIIN